MLPIGLAIAFAPAFSIGLVIALDLSDVWLNML